MCSQRLIGNSRPAISCAYATRHFHPCRFPDGATAQEQVRSSHTTAVNAHQEQGRLSLVQLGLLRLDLAPGFLLVVPEGAPARERGDLVKREDHLAARFAVRVPALAQRSSPCRILYRDIGDYLMRERKLEMLREAGSIAAIYDWQQTEPDRHDDWIGQRDETLNTFIPLRSERRKSDGGNNAIFALFSNGQMIGRDAYVYNCSYDARRTSERRVSQNFQDALRD